jgi:hypothetical protein
MPATGKNMAYLPNASHANLETLIDKNSINLIDVYGGKNTNPLWTSQVGNIEFKKALIDSLKAHQLYNNESPKYNLSVGLMSISEPFFGLDFTVQAKSKIHLTEASTNKIKINEDIESSYTAKVSENFIGTLRLKAAKEGAIRNNIEKIINRLKAFKNQ